MIGIRSTLLGGMATIAILLGAPIQSVADEACKQMQVYLSIAPHHREDVMSYIAPKLKQDLGVELVAEAIGSAMMVDRLNAQAGAPRITIAQWDVPIGIAACEKGLCVPLDLSRAPNAQHLADWAYSNDKDGKPVVLTTGALGVGFLYNADAFAKHNIKPPTSWKELTDQAFAGRLGLTAPQSTMGTAELVMLSKIGGGSEANVNPGFDAVKAILAKGNTVFTWSSEMSNLLQLGDLWIAVNSSNLAPALRAQGLPIHFVWPTEGAPTVNSGLSLIKDAPCQDAAYEYINLYYSREFQMTHMLSGGGLSASTAIWDKLTPQQLADLDLQPGDLQKLTPLDWQKINADRPGWIERWQREIH